MDKLRPNETVVKQGVFTYAGKVECDVRIVRSPVQYGSGDWEDAPEDQNDQMRETYYVQFGSTTQRGLFNSVGANYPSMETAMHGARAVPGIGSSIRWLDE